MLKEVVLILFISYCANAVVTVKQAQWAFTNILDKDQNNYVDAADLCAVANNLDEIPCDAITGQSAKFIAKFDKDNSNSVDMEEFVNVYARIGNLGNPVEPGIQQVHLSLTTDPTEMVVMWVTKDQVGTIVRYGTQPGKYTHSTNGTITTYNVGVGGWHGWIHTVTLTGLTPGQTYFYQAGVQGYYWSQEYYFTTAPPLYTTSNYTWAVMGDMGTVNPMGWAVTDQMINDNSNTPFNMVLLVGDIAYAGTGSTWEFEEIWDIWEDQVEPLAAICPWMFSVGNHEKYYNFTAYNTRFLMPGEQSGGYHNFWYSITYGDVHWTMISTEHDYSPTSPQYAWLMKDLEAAAANPKIHWIIMNGHRPMYCSNTNEWDNEHEGSDFQKWIEPLMLKYNVDLYLSGHQHMYERVYPVINGTVIMKGNHYVDPHAPVHIVQGTGGANASADDIIPEPVWSAVRNDLWGYGRMTTTESELYYEFLNLETYKVVDTFSITKTQ